MSRKMDLTRRNLAVNCLYYSVTLGALPSGALWLQARWSEPAGGPWPLRVLAILLGLTGLGLQGWCIVLLQTEGSGTPSPLVATVRLVTKGPYAWVRNPLNVGELFVFLALAAWFKSWILLVYLLLAWVAFHMFIILWEEPRHQREFGDPFVKYRARISRWWPRRPKASPYAPAAEHGHAPDVRQTSQAVRGARGSRARA